MTTEYQPTMKAYPHQTEALEKMNGHPTFALLMAMRTGKTKVLLDNFGHLELDGKVRDLLVIAPAGVYRTWNRAIIDHCSDDLLRRAKIYIWDSGKSQTKGERDKQERFLNLCRFADCDCNPYNSVMICEKHTKRFPRILLMNIEALSGVRRAQQFCLDFLCERDKAMIAVDESTIIKTPKAARTKFVCRQLAPRAKYRRILSGLPTPRSPLDLYCQFEFLDPAILGFRSYYSFRNVHAVIRNEHIGGRIVPLVVGYRGIEQLQAKIEPHSFRVPFRPKIPSTYTIREVTLTEEQKRIYNEIKTFATAQLDNESHVTATVVITQILRLHQVLCGHTRDELGYIHEIPENKTWELVQLLEDYDGKAIIWCSYDWDITKVSSTLQGIYGSTSVARFWGGNTGTREDEEKEFLNNPDCRFMVATPSAGGRGRTWSNADLVVYYSSTNDLEHRDQSEQRAQGLDKSRQVDYIDLIAPGTVETKILHALRNKINMAASITGDAWREWLI